MSEPAYFDKAARCLEGEQYAAGFLELVKAGHAQSDDLASFIGFLTGDMQRAFCRRVQKEVEARRA